jgi:hippurate hydrolase
VRNEENGIVHNVHTPKFNVDEAAINYGVQMMSWLGASANVSEDVKEFKIT